MKIKGWQRLAAGVLSALLVTGVPQVNAVENDFSSRACAAEVQLSPRVVELDLKLQATDKKQEQLSILTEMINIQPDYVLAYFARGIVNSELKNNNQALADYNRGLELQPDFLEGYLARGNLYEALGRVNEAVADYTKIIEGKPDAYGIYYRRGRLYMRSDQIEKALADVEKSIELFPTQESYSLRSAINILMEKYEQALEDVNKALTITQRNKSISDGKLYLQKAGILAELGRFCESFESWSLANDYATYLEKKGTIPKEELEHLLRLYRTRAAEEICSYLLKRAAEEENQGAAARANSYVREAAKCFPDKAVYVYTRALDEIANRPEFLCGRGDGYYLKKDYSRAEADYRKALSLEISNADAYRGLGYVCYAGGQYQQALEYLKTGLLYKPDYAGLKKDIAAVESQIRKEEERREAERREAERREAERRQAASKKTKKTVQYTVATCRNCHMHAKHRYGPGHWTWPREKYGDCPSPRNSHDHYWINQEVISDFEEDDE